MAPPTEAEPASTSHGYLYVLCFVAALGGLIFGFDTAVISGTIPFITPHFGLGEAGVGWAVSSVIMGAMTGLLFAGRLSDRFGRKRILLATAAAYAVSALGTALAGDFTLFILARILGGMAVGTASMVSPLYIAEISPSNIRGRLVALNQLTIVVGILLAFFSNYLLVDTGVHNWRWMFGAEAIPATAFFLALFLVPESPRWLVREGEEDAAGAVLARIRDSRDIAPEIAEIREVLRGSHEGSWRDLIAPSLRRVLTIGIVLAILQQVTGINVVMYYAPTIFEQTGSATDSALLQTVVVGFVNLVFTLLAMRLVDVVGRKPLMLAGAFGMLAALSFLSGAYAMGKAEGIIVLVSFVVYVASFSASLGPIVWVVLSEIFPIKVRGLVMSTATFVLWTANFVVSMSFPWLIARLEGALTFMIYAVMCALTVLFVWRKVPETKGKSLEELEKELVGVEF